MTNLLLRGSLAVIDRSSIPIVSTLAGGFKDFLEFYKEIKDNQQRDADKQLLEEKLAELTQWHQELNQALLSKHGDVTQLYAWKDEITQTLEKLLAGQKYATGQLSELNAEQPIALTLDLLPEKNRRALETALKRGPLDLKNLDPEHANIITNDTQFILPWKTLKEAMRGSEPASLVATGDRNGLEVVVKEQKIQDQNTQYLKTMPSSTQPPQPQNKTKYKEGLGLRAHINRLLSTAVLCGTVTYLGLPCIHPEYQWAKKAPDPPSKYVSYDDKNDTIVVRQSKDGTSTFQIDNNVGENIIGLLTALLENDRSGGRLAWGQRYWTPEYTALVLSKIEYLDRKSKISTQDYEKLRELVIKGRTSDQIK